ncbi:hypothetical protein BDC45DRAFT_534179 [Circinella umbellata]|nr:hypothetical protein BDC45DRAFT_534179 [Circinella umbellata]
MFNYIQKKWGELRIDAFAAHHNYQLPIYWAGTPDPAATAIDAMSQIWLLKGMYLYPPWKLIPQVLKKFQKHKIKRTVLIRGQVIFHFASPVILRLRLIIFNFALFIVLIYKDFRKVENNQGQIQGNQLKERMTIGGTTGWHNVNTTKLPVTHWNII